jgi:hypothetical protein
MFFQISRTLQRKWHAKRTSRAPRNGPTSVCSSIASLHKNGFGLASLQHNSTLSILDYPPWPQTGLVYIDLKLVIHLQLPPKIWAPKMPNISQKWRKSIKIRLKSNKNPKTIVKNPLLYKIRALSPEAWARAPLARSYRAMWPSASPSGYALAPFLALQLLVLWIMHRILGLTI